MLVHVYGHVVVRVYACMCIYIYMFVIGCFVFVDSFVPIYI